MFALLFGIMVLLIIAVGFVSLVGVRQANKRRAAWLAETTARQAEQNRQSRAAIDELRARQKAQWDELRSGLDRTTKENEAGGS
ncbi:hypothetical protein [Nocardioides halotolerans]|uniref:hypothetical protein n=1 Tax=Nocardioides halotolerans TaxID=433660 RepID=UPI00048F5601|nr:hypothetical protein [Nocardioides halotolerans]